jgi:IS4 transposase
MKENEQLFERLIIANSKPAPINILVFDPNKFHNLDLLIFKYCIKKVETVDLLFSDLN